MRSIVALAAAAALGLGLAIEPHHLGPTRVVTERLRPRKPPKDKWTEERELRAKPVPAGTMTRQLRRAEEREAAKAPVHERWHERGRR